MESEQCEAVVRPPPPSSGPGRPSPELSSDLELDEAQAEANHSSEEELEGFNCREREKRKWSQMKRTSRDSSCSSDEEMAAPRVGPATPAPVQFRSSPPAGAHRPGRATTPPRRSPVVPAAAAAAAVAVPPSARGRKRHRGLASLGMQRPCLDFEKMQQEGIRSVTTWRPSAELSLFCW